MNKFLDKIFSLERPTKRLIQVTVDVILIIFCFWLAIALRLDGITTKIDLETLFLVVPVSIITFFAFVILGLYRAIVRYMSEKAVLNIIIGSCVSAVSIYIFSKFLGIPMPRSVPIIYFAFLTIFIGGVRFAMRGLHLAMHASKRVPIIIYGSDKRSVSLMRAIEESAIYRPVAFLSKTVRMRGLKVANKPILNPKDFPHYQEKLKASIVVIPTDDVNDQKLQTVTNDILRLGLEPRLITSAENAIQRPISTSDVKKIDIRTLIGRPAVLPNIKLMSRNITGKSILVSGAGGSIGGELCRQILTLSPKTLILFDISEFGLHTISESLAGNSTHISASTEIAAILGSVTNKNLLNEIISTHQVDTFIHAAAYKHVPIVESNHKEAFQNNVIGTRVAAEAAGINNVQNFILISSDKAVRPTNVMGATKRLAELVIQEAALSFPSTQFCAVRFGNVVGSSGSVIPKFEKQISNGGPITVTHPNVIRYFMTIEEAAQLVLQAGGMNTNGRIYVLDMGKPIKILDLAKLMIQLSGKKPVLTAPETKLNQDEIAIKIVGLRSGEKMYEELLVSDDQMSTEHPRIFFEKNLSSYTYSIDQIVSKLLNSNFYETQDILLSAEIGYTIPLKNDH